MTKASIATTHYQVSLTNGRHSFDSDEPKDLGGTDMGPAPDELLEASLASCTAITLRMYANRKEWKVDAIDVTVNLERLEQRTVFTRSIAIQGSINQVQRDRLLQIAKACPVSKSLLGEMEINTLIS